MEAALGVPLAPAGGHGVAAVTSHLALVAGGTASLGGAWSCWAAFAEHPHFLGWFRGFWSVWRCCRSPLERCPPGWIPAGDRDVLSRRFPRLLVYAVI